MNLEVECKVCGKVVSKSNTQIKNVSDSEWYYVCKLGFGCIPKPIIYSDLTPQQRISHRNQPELMSGLLKEKYGIEFSELERIPTTARDGNIRFLYPNSQTQYIWVLGLYDWKIGT